ncbi:nucleotidyltransferase domain-containing protein [Sulfurimonas sediminis]|uniref:Nucleotidyltransferase domain-containing protein n=1 Tax=Sulfurimonas sediminis TaxID=2590020 RepID=A0A7M1AZZ6_9BACT|nr:nucleotidyltransferase domain-containing protein [Sulfurimonas sediminis]QOP42955.1 nucleotidyltransferase domain-containing protein [Sulfurimonas sediminis]
MAKIDKIKKIIHNINEIEFAYLFGSYAKNTQTDKSDIDIAVHVKEEYNNFDTKLKIHHKLEINLHKDIDLIILNNAKNFDLLEDIFNEGIILQDAKDDERILFELAKEHEIQDYKIFKRMLDVA